MKKNLQTSALSVALTVASMTATATGFVQLPATGVVIDGGKSAYVTCNTTGEFGSNPNGSTPPTFSPNGGANNTCALKSIDPPVAGYTQTASVVRDIVMNNAYTLNQPITVGTVVDRVWRKGVSCIYGAKIRLNNVDYDRRAISPGVQYFEVNDILRANFLKKAPVSVAYVYTTRGPGQSDDVVYRAGLTNTSVVNFPGDPAQPLVSVAPINRKWVDFTTDISFQDDDGSSVRDSAWLLVKSTCTERTPAETDGALKFRQMGQEEQPLIEVRVKAFDPSAQ